MRSILNVPLKWQHSRIEKQVDGSAIQAAQGGSGSTRLWRATTASKREAFISRDCFLPVTIVMVGL